MKKRKIVIVNRGKRTLHLFCKKCKLPGQDKFMVRNRKVLKLLPGDYNLEVFYSDRTVVLESSMDGDIQVEDVISNKDNRFMGKRILLSDSINKLKITCKEQLSVASIVEAN